MFINGLTGAILMMVSLFCFWHKIISAKAYIFIMCVLLIMMFVGFAAIDNAYVPGISAPIDQTILDSYYPLIISSLISLVIVIIKFHSDDS